jgi:hypothetical protein
MVSIFRTIVAISLIAHATGLFLLPHMPWLFSADARELSMYSGHGALINVHHVALYGLYLLPYPSLIAMYFFRNWGRYVFAVFIGAVGLSTFFFGTSVSGPPETFVSFVACLCDGAVLALAFGSPLASQFGKSTPA